MVERPLEDQEPFLQRTLALFFIDAMDEITEVFFNVPDRDDVAPAARVHAASV
jgi:hypothetical protein